jgi:hypothetical protein
MATGPVRRRRKAEEKRTKEKRTKVEDHRSSSIVLRSSVFLQYLDLAAQGQLCQTAEGSRPGRIDAKMAELKEDLRRTNNQLLEVMIHPPAGGVR